MTYKLLATDMDGTLLKNNKEISCENIASLKKAYNRGVEIVICTGRSYSAVIPYMKKLDLPCWVVTNNGAVIRDKEGKVISVTYIKPEKLKRVIELLKAEKEIYYHISDSHKTYIQSIIQRIRGIYGFIVKNKGDVLKACFWSVWVVLLNGSHQKVNFNTFIKEGRKGAGVFILSDCPDKLKSLSHKLCQIGEIEVTSSGWDNIEVLDENANKGQALKQLAGLLNIKQEEVVAVGDHLNDLSMISYAGLGVAVGNGVKEVIEKADWVTKTNEENGIAYLIEEKLLILSKQV
jgi:Cof subfamily protein (haloacid dehalogenase superfamily)